MKVISAIALASLVLLSSTVCAQDWTKENKDRGKRAALHDAAQRVRGDSGKWNDDARLQHMPALEQLPAKMTHDAWADLYLKKQPDLTDKDGHTLIYRSEQLDDNDRVWIERIERRGQQVTIVANQAKWQGKLFRNFSYYQVIAVKLGTLEAGKYDVKWVTQPLVFSKFDGDGKALDANWPSDERPAEKKATELRLSLVVKARAP
jgi:hypothetical protein